ncbi:MAG TPA: YggS family pyridoxal phosphate-dependent enzyme [Polyangiales bacterium]
MSAAEQAQVAIGLQAVRERIAAACVKAGRSPESVKLIAVSKRHSVDAIRTAYAQGQREFGENYVQELVQKAAELADLSDLRWRLIGRLQRNKAKEVARIGCAVDTVDSLRLGDALAARAAEEGRTLEVLVQVNIGAEAQKAGSAIADLPGLVAGLRALPALHLRGLLAIPPVVSDPEHSRASFRRLRELGSEHGLHELSMGMSDDLEVAIQEGATMLRIGTAIFGQRPSAA